jgi:hypothetical protein
VLAPCLAVLHGCREERQGFVGEDAIVAVLPRAQQRLVQLADVEVLAQVIQLGEVEALWRDAEDGAICLLTEAGGPLVQRELVCPTLDN